MRARGLFRVFFVFIAAMLPAFRVGSYRFGTSRFLLIGSKFSIPLDFNFFVDSGH